MQNAPNNEYLGQENGMRLITNMRAYKRYAPNNEKIQYQVKVVNAHIRKIDYTTIAL